MSIKLLWDIREAVPRKGKAMDATNAVWLIVEVLNRVLVSTALFSTEQMAIDEANALLAARAEKIGEGGRYAEAKEELRENPDADYDQGGICFARPGKEGAWLSWRGDDWDAFVVRVDLDQTKQNGWAVVEIAERGLIDCHTCANKEEAIQTLNNRLGAHAIQCGMLKDYSEFLDNNRKDMRYDICMASPEALESYCDWQGVEWNAYAFELG